MDIETAAMGLIGNAGEARSIAFEALELAKSGKIKEAKEKLASAKDASLKAHEIQTELIVKEADGEGLPYALLMVHAQDHLMTAMLARELIAELIAIYEKYDGTCCK